MISATRLVLCSSVRWRSIRKCACQETEQKEQIMELSVMITLVACWGAEGTGGVQQLSSVSACNSGWGGATRGHLGWVYLQQTSYVPGRWVCRPSSRSAGYRQTRCLFLLLSPGHWHVSHRSHPTHLGCGWSSCLTALSSLTHWNGSRILCNRRIRIKSNIIKTMCVVIE